MTLRRMLIPALAALVAVGVLIRLQVCRELLAADVQVARPSGLTDMHTYKVMSEQLLRGEFEGEFYYQPFYYAVFLTTLKRLFGLGPWPVMAAQAVLSALTAWLAGLTAARLWGRAAGLAAALTCTFSAMLIFYVPYHLLEILQAFWVTLIAYLGVEALRRGTWQRWTALGLVVGMAILTRGNLWILVPGLLVAAAWREARTDGADDGAVPSPRQLPWHRIILTLSLMLAAIILVQVPFAWRNSRLRGRLTGPSTAAGAVLGLGNTPEAPPGGREPGTGPGPMEYPRTYQAWGQELGQASVAARILGWARREPGAFLELQWRKLLLYWDAGEIPNNIAWEHQGVRSPTLQRCGIVSTGLLMALALASAIPLALRIFRRGLRCLPSALTAHPGRHLLLYLLLAYWLATAAFYILARFRVPSIPLFAIFAGGSVATVALRLRRRRWGALAGRSLPTVLGALLFVNLGYAAYRHGLESRILRLVRPDGTRTALAAGGVMVLDHGPMSFGGWMPVAVSDGVAFEKRFVLDPADLPGKTARLVLPILWEIPGKAVVQVNGIDAGLHHDKPGMEEAEIPVPIPEDGRILLRFSDIDAKILLAVDRQRHYGRTRIGGEDPGAELVSCLILERPAPPRDAAPAP